MSLMIASIVSTMSSTFLLTLVYFYVFMQYHERYICIWAFSWLSYWLSYVLAFWMLVGQESPVLLILNQLFILISGLLLTWGTYEFLDKDLPKWWVYGIFPGTIWIGIAILSQFSFLLLAFPTFTFLGIGYIWTGLVILRFRKFHGVGKHLTGFAFILWGIHKLYYPYLQPVHWFAPWGYYLVTLILEFLAAIGILLIFFDKMGKALVKSEERFRLLAENARDMIYRYQLKPSLRFEYVSPASLFIFGYNPEELYADSKLVLKMVHPEDRLLLRKLRKYPQDFLETIVLRWIHKNGSIIWIEHSNVPIYDEAGNLVALEGIARDITERKQAEEILQRYELLSKWARDIILMMNLDGSIIEANTSAIKAYGYTREDLLSLKFQNLYAPNSVSTADDHLRKAENSGILFETIHLRKDGSSFPVEVSLQGMMIGRKYGILSIIRDITQRKKEELEMLEARERVARAERMASLGTMAAGIAHEINQPLNSLAVIVEGMLYWYEKKRPMAKDKIVENLQKMSKRVNRIDNIIKHMYSFVRSDPPSKLVPCNLNDAVEGALALIGTQIKSHGIEVRKKLLDNLPSVQGESIRLEEVVINLLVNAMQALDKISKNNKKIECRTRVEGALVIMEISDDGPGVNNEIKDKIFEPFFTTKEPGNGMGLGLFLAHSIVTYFNGEIFVNNNEHGGAIFRVEFPIFAEC